MSKQFVYKILKVNAATQEVAKEAILTSDEFEELVFAGNIDASYKKVKPLFNEVVGHR